MRDKEGALFSEQAASARKFAERCSLLGLRAGECYPADLFKLDTPQLKIGTLDSLMVGPPRATDLITRQRSHSNTRGCNFLHCSPCPTTWESTIHPSKSVPRSLLNNLNPSPHTLWLSHQMVIRKIERQYQDMAGATAPPLAVNSGGPSVALLFF